MFRLAVLCFSLLLLVRVGQSQIREGLPYPPIFTNLTDTLEVTAPMNKPLQWPCQARSNPPSRYAWYHNDERVSTFWLGGKVRYSEDEGTLYLITVDNTYGKYYCRATNSLPLRGADKQQKTDKDNVDETIRATAQSLPIVIRQSKFAPFPDFPVHNHIARHGDYFRINCSSPFNVPRATYSWAEYETKQTLQGPQFFVEPFSGDLLVLAVTNSTLTQEVVECCALNRVSGVTMRGSKQRIVVSEQLTAFHSRSPVLRYRTPSTDSIFTEGDNTASISCVFSAYPLAQVEWRRPEGLLRGVPVENTNGHTLRFNNVTRQMAGTYLCRGSNQNGTTDWMDINVVVRLRPTFTRSFESSVIKTFDSPVSGSYRQVDATTAALNVQRTGGLLQNVEGGLVNLTVGSSVHFNCSCTGDPQTTIVWTFNGVPVDEASALPLTMTDRVSQRRPDNTLLVSNVQIGDSGNVIACECRNVVGRAMRTFGLLIFDQTRIIERPIVDSGNTLTINVDERAAADMKLFAKQNALRCSARTDHLTQLSVAWWNAEKNTTMQLASTPFQDVVDILNVQRFEDTDDEELLSDLYHNAESTSTTDAGVLQMTATSTQMTSSSKTPPYSPSNDPADWFASTLEYQSGMDLAIATLDVRAMLTVAWRRRDTQLLFRVKFECRATNTLSRASFPLTVLINTTAYVRSRLGEPKYNVTVSTAPVTEAGINTWWIVVAAVCGALAVLIAVAIAVYCARRNRGASYPLEKHELATGRDPLLELRVSGFAPLIRQNDVVKGRLFESLEQAFAGESDEIASSNGERSKSALLDDDDTFADYDRTDQRLSSLQRPYAPSSVSATPNKYSIANGDCLNPNAFVGANGTLSRNAAHHATGRASAERTIPHAESSRYSLVTFPTGTINRNGVRNQNGPYEPANAINNHVA